MQSKKNVRKDVFKLNFRIYLRLLKNMDKHCDDVKNKVIELVAMI